MPAESYPRYSRRSSPCRRRGYASRDPTYPMIPHTWNPFLRALASSFAGLFSACPRSSFLRNPPENEKARLSAELSGDESRDPTTEAVRSFLGFCLDEDADHRLRPGRANHHAPAGREALDLLAKRRRHLLRTYRNVGLRLRQLPHPGGELAKGASALAESPAEEQSADQAV